jgi:hypothetical protein
VGGRRFNWPLTLASCIDFVGCCRRWRLLSHAHAAGEVSDETKRIERREIIMDFLGYVVGEMFLNIFGLRNPNAVLPDFWIYFGSLLCPLFNEHGFIRTFTERQRAAVYAKQKAAKELRQAQAAEAAEAAAEVESTASESEEQPANAAGRSSPIAG